MKLFLIILVLIIVGVFSFAWGWGLHVIVIANDRRKRLFAARKQRLTPIPYQVPDLPVHISRARANIKYNKDGQIYVVRFDA
jgi:hypothetical protein